MQRVGKGLHELSLESLGKFLIGGKILGGLSLFFFFFAFFFGESCLDEGDGFVCCFGSTEKIKAFITGYLYGETVLCALWHMHTLSASLPLHKWKWSCGVVWLGGWSAAVALQHVPTVKCFHFISVAKSGCAVFICQAGHEFSKVSMPV